MRLRTSFTLLSAAVTTAVASAAVLSVGGCADSTPKPTTAASVVWPSQSAVASSAPADASPSVAPPVTPSVASVPAVSCVPGGGWDCDQQRRFAAAAALVSRKAGKLGVIVHDRGSGAVWRTGSTENTTWTASTIKLAIAAAVLEWNRAGKITIDATDRSNLHAALVNSSNDAATALWDRYGGQPMFDRFRGTYGMSSLSVVSGYELFWRNLRCSAEDLHNLMVYVLDRTHLDDRVYLIGELRGVASNQRWGVWAAGSSLRPGNKDGWAQKPDTGGTHWVTHTVGFAGPGERYVVVATYSLTPSGTLNDGTHAVSDVIATVFGAPVPARISTP
jgi:hypothetical protein